MLGAGSLMLWVKTFLRRRRGRGSYRVEQWTTSWKQPLGNGFSLCSMQRPKVGAGAAEGLGLKQE